MAQLYTTFIKAELALQLTYGFYFVGYLSVTAAFVLGILALASPGDRKPETGSSLAQAMDPTRVNFEKLNRQWLRFGFLMLACGLIINYAWGWDPKADLGLISWLIYGAVLHLHYTPIFKGRKAVWASLFAWGLVLFAYFGMDKLPTKSQAMHFYTEPPAAGEEKP